MSDLPPDKESDEQRTERRDAIADFVRAAGKDDFKEVKEYILNKGDINASDSFGNTALSNAVAKSNTEMVEFLILNGADVNKVNKMKTSPLHRAVNMGLPEIVKLLLDHGAKKSVNVQDDRGYTPLHWAIETSGGESLEVIKLLLAHGADSTITNNLSATPLSMAEERTTSYRSEFQDIVDLLRDQKGDPSPTSPKMKPG